MMLAPSIPVQQYYSETSGISEDQRARIVHDEGLDPILLRFRAVSNALLTKKCGAIIFKRTRIRGTSVMQCDSCFHYT